MGHRMMDCETCRTVLLESADIAGQRSPHAEADAHLERCAECREWWKDARVADRCLADTRPVLMEAPPINAVWARIRSNANRSVEPRSRRSAATGWLTDILGVFLAAAIVVGAGIGFRALFPAWDFVLPVLSPPSESILTEVWTAAFILVLFGMFAGACSAPLLLRGRIHGSGRHEQW